MPDPHAVLKSILRRVGLSLVGAALLGQTLTVAAQVVVPGTPNPVLTKTMTPPRPKMGEPARIVITATNAGPVNAENVVITDPLPDNIALNSVTTTQGSIT